MIVFKKLFISGFGSMVEPYSIEFRSKGLILVKGENGAGKTTLFSALYWVLYGKTLKDKSTVTTWEHLQPKDYLGTYGYVELLRDGKYLKVIRCQDYKGEIVPGVKGANRIMIVDKDNKDLYPLKSKPEVQAKIASAIIGLSPELFKSSIIFGQKMKRLVDEDGPTKKRIFEEAFGVDYINIAKDLAYKRYKEIEKDLIPIDRLHFGRLSAIEAKKAALNAIQLRMATYEKDKANQVKDLREALKGLKLKLKTLLEDKPIYLEHNKAKEELADKIKKLEARFKENEYYDILGKLANDEAKLTQYKREIEKLEEALKKAKKSDKCPTCGGIITPQDLADHIAEIKQSINQFQTALIEVEKANKGHKIKLASLLKIKKHIEIKESEYAKLDFDGSEHINYMPQSEEKLISEINAQKTRIKALKKSSVDFGEEEAIGELSRLENEAKESGKQLKQLKHKFQVQEWLYAKALSNSGLKAFIFNQMLNSLNILLEGYSKQFGIRPYFMIDMESARKDIIAYAYINGAPVSFSDLSGGQAQLANIITAFAAHDLIAKGRFNILVLDEVFESLSSTNIEIVSELINYKTLDQQVFLITHLTAFQPTGARTLEFKLQDGVTRPLF